MAEQKGRRGPVFVARAYGTDLVLPIRGKLASDLRFLRSYGYANRVTGRALLRVLAAAVDEIAAELAMLLTPADFPQPATMEEEGGPS